MSKVIGVLACALALLAGASSGGGGDAGAQQDVNPADFSTRITNPLFPISLVGPKGRRRTRIPAKTVPTRLESRVLPETAVVAGVTVTVLEEKASVDGELVEVALDYFAQHRNGDVYYFGELVDNYENGALRDHAGQWLAGDGENRPGILMPAQPVVGTTYQQEYAPGVAEDQTTPVSLTETVRVPAGTYTGCMETRDTTLLEPDIEEFKWFCPGVGMAREEASDAVSELVSIGPPPEQAAPTATPSVAPVVAPSTGEGGDNEGRDGGTMFWLIAAAGIAVVVGGAVVWRLATRRSP